MRCRKLNTDQEAELSIYANRARCQEYVLPYRTIREPNTIECYIPVKAEDRITLKGSFSGSVLQGSFDLVVDGSFLCESRIEGSHGQIKLHKNRKIEFKQVLQCPIPEGWTSIENPKDLYEGCLIVKPFSARDQELQKSRISGSGPGNPGVGSISVFFSLSQRATETYKNSYGNITCGQWREQNSMAVCDDSIAPEMAMDVEIAADEDPISGKRSAKHRRHQYAERFGPEPWAQFVFHYRTQAAIDNAGCVPLVDAAQELVPDLPGVFVYSEDAPGWPKKQKQRRENVKIEETSSDSSRDGGLFVSPDACDQREYRPEIVNTTKTSTRLGGDLVETTVNTATFPLETRQQKHQDGFANMSYGDESAIYLDNIDPEEASIAENAKIKEEFEDLDMNLELFSGVFSDTHTPRDRQSAPTSLRLHPSIRDQQVGSTVPIEAAPRPRGDEQARFAGLGTQTLDQLESDPDSTKLPSTEEMEAFFESYGAKGVSGSNLYNLFKDCGPYLNELQAQEEFQERYQEIAHMEPSHKRWYLGKGSRNSGQHVERRFPILHSKNKVRTSSRGFLTSREKEAFSVQDQILDDAERDNSPHPISGSPSSLSISTTPVAAPALPASSGRSKRISSIFPTPGSAFKHPRTQVEEDVVRYELELQEKLALQHALREKIRLHDDRHMVEQRLKREEAAKQKLEELRRDLAEADIILRNLAREEELKGKGEWAWDDENNSESSLNEAVG